MPSRAQGNTTVIEQMIILVMGIFFGTWDNGPQVLQNLQKYYSKTPA
jgi:hypothetical protein